MPYRTLGLGLLVSGELTVGDAAPSDVPVSVVRMCCRGSSALRNQGKRQMN